MTLVASISSHFSSQWAADRKKTKLYTMHNCNPPLYPCPSYHNNPTTPQQHHWLLFLPARIPAAEHITNPLYPTAAVQTQHPYRVLCLAWPQQSPPCTKQPHGAHRLIVALPLTQAGAAVSSPWQCRHPVWFVLCLWLLIFSKLEDISSLKLFPLSNLLLKQTGQIKLMVRKDLQPA